MKSKLNIGLISTLGTNIGDDFIRIGIVKLLKNVFNNENIKFHIVNKHDTFSAYPNFHPIQIVKHINYLPKSYIFKNYLRNRFSKLKNSFFDKCDLIVNCGTPVAWPDCYKCEWAEPLWMEIIGRLFDKVPVLNIAAGSCYPWEYVDNVLKNENDIDYLSKILKYSSITTARDKLAKSIFDNISDSDIPLLPCTAFVSPDNDIAYNSSSSDLVLINYMSGGGHYDWGQNIVPETWEKIVKNLINSMSKRHQLAFLCHDLMDYKSCIELDPDLPIIFPKTTDEYFKLVSSAKIALCNRMHASVVLAGLGIPTISICTDTRLLMLEALGLPYYYVKNVESDILEEEIEKLILSKCVVRERLFEVKEDTFNKYIDVFSSITIS